MTHRYVALGSPNSIDSLQLSNYQSRGQQRQNGTAILSWNPHIGESVIIPHETTTIMTRCSFAGQPQVSKTIDRQGAEYQLSTICLGTIVALNSTATMITSKSSHHRVGNKYAHTTRGNFGFPLAKIRLYWCSKRILKN